MKLARRCGVVVLALLPASAWPAELKVYHGWNQSPEFVMLATKAEQKEWKAVASDMDAEHFVQRFWARRNPDSSAPVNEFKRVFDLRVKEADALFSMRRTRGALTERGTLYVLVGPPKTLKRIPGTKPRPPLVDGFMPAAEPGRTLGEQIAVFVYDADQLPGWALVKSLEATFVVEENRDYVASRDAGTVRAIEARGRTASIRNPEPEEPRR